MGDSWTGHRNLEFMIVRKKLNLEERIKLPNESGLRKEMVLVFTAGK